MRCFEVYKMKGDLMNIAISIGGGLGDVIRECFHTRGQYTYFGRLEDYYSKNPDAKLQIITTSHNPSSGELFELFPWIDHITQGKWGNAPKTYLTPGYVYMNNTTAEDFFKYYEFKILDFACTKEENDIFAAITARPYVIVYPFGGYGARISANKYAGLVAKLTIAGYQTVIVGASHVRDGNRDITETFDYEQEGVWNLLGKSPRLTAKLAKHADAYIGSIGCFMHAAMAGCVKSVIMTCHEIWPFWEDHPERIDPTLWPYYEKYNKVNFVRINNEECLESLWSLIVKLILMDDEYRYLIWGNAKRESVVY